MEWRRLRPVAREPLEGGRIPHRVDIGKHFDRALLQSGQFRGAQGCHPSFQYVRWGIPGDHTFYIAHDKERGPKPLRVLYVPDHVGHRDVGAGPDQIHAVPLQTQIEDRECGVGRLFVRGEPGHVSIPADVEQHGLICHAIVRHCAVTENRIHTELVGYPVGQSPSDVDDISPPGSAFDDESVMSSGPLRLYSTDRPIGSDKTNRSNMFSDKIRRTAPYSVFAV